MKWSIRLGTFAGIGVYMHLTFLLLLAWVAIWHWMQERSVSATLAGVGFVLAIFACVVLHEFGHALTARRYGIRTRDITLLLIGGLARLERMPEEPIQELWVALAGPAVNVAIAAVLFVGLGLTGGLEPLAGLGLAQGSFLARLMAVNVLLVVFNLIPAFPMDGGRVLRALLATRMEYTQATNIAATTGQGFALLFGFIGLFSNPFLLFIAFFVWIGAAQEASMVQMKTSLSGIPVRRAMLTDFQTLLPSSSLADAVELTLKTSQKDFPVLEGTELVGILRQQELIPALSSEGPQGRVADVMQREFVAVDALDMLETAFQRFNECSCRTLPVFQQGRLVGMVTMDNLGEFLAIQGALQQVKRA